MTDADRCPAPLDTKELRAAFNIQYDMLLDAEAARTEAEQELRTLREQHEQFIASSNGLVKLATDSAEKWEQRAHGCATDLAALRAALVALRDRLRDPLMGFDPYTISTLNQQR